MNERETLLREALLEFVRVERMFGHNGQHKDSECADCKRVRQADIALSRGFLRDNVTDIGRLQYLERVFETADVLERWLGENTGTNDDWPIEIKADSEGASKLSTLLQDLKYALMPLRPAKTP